VRICFVSQQIGDIRTGVGTYANALIPALARAGHEAVVVGRGRAPAWDRVEYRAVPAAPRDPTPEGWLSFAWRAAALLGGPDGADLVHFLDAREALFLRRLHRTPAVGTIHDCYLADASPSPLYWKRRYGDWLARWVYHRLARRLEGRALGKLDFLIANSRWVERAVTTAYHLAPGAAATVYLGFSFTDASRPGVRPGAEVLFVGGNFQRKGLPTLLRALVGVKARVPDVRLQVIGDHPARAGMVALAESLGLADRVRFLGHLPHDAVVAHYGTARVLAMPSEVEGFGITLLEALHAGVPVVASSQGGSTELVQDGRNGYLVAPGDVGALAERLTRLLTDDRLCEELGARGRETADRFTLARMVEETLAVYRTVLARGQTGQGARR
jgi:glycosyltransferase involved in cell wall biosynthesis